jgi:hypothetical protein
MSIQDHTNTLICQAIPAPSSQDHTDTLVCQATTASRPHRTIPTHTSARQSQPWPHRTTQTHSSAMQWQPLVLTGPPRPTRLPGNHSLSSSQDHTDPLVCQAITASRPHRTTQTRSSARQSQPHVLTGPHRPIVCQAITASSSQDHTDSLVC